MEKVWCGSRNKTLKGANTVFAQDAKNNMIVYTRAYILRKEESEEKRIYKLLEKIKDHNIKETLVFDCHFTKYTLLDEITDDEIKFVTLRKRHKNSDKNAEKSSYANIEKC